jgi:hypothetical protein
MAYICNDCSYRGVSSGQDGECPACGSFDLRSNNSQAATESPSMWPLWRLRLLVALWTVLIIMIAWKLIN